MNGGLLSSIRETIKRKIFASRLFRRFATRYGVEHLLLPGLISGTSSTALRNMLLLPPSKYQTQLNQDIFALLLSHFKAGYFIEIGANDGYTLSNTIYLEEHFGWRGLLIEANSRYIQSLSTRKNSCVINKAVSTDEGSATFVDAGLYGGLSQGLDSLHLSHTRDAPMIVVVCEQLENILREAEAPHVIDFISIDVEGGELPILKQMVKSTYRFKCGCIEHNHRPYDVAEFTRLLVGAGYLIWGQGQTGHDLFFYDGKQK